MAEAESDGDAAEFYDALYAWKDYAGEAAQVRKILAQEGLKWEARVLEGACGSGRYLEHLAPHFEVAGFDLSAAMLAEARARLPKRTMLFEADLCRLQLPVLDGDQVAPFDAFLLLFGGLGYVPADHLAVALAGIWGALKPGGLFICEPWLTPDQFVAGEPHMLVINRDDLKLCRQVVTQREGRKSILDYRIMISRPDRPTQVLRDLNTLTLYTADELNAAFRGAGFELERVLEGFMKDRELLIMRRL